MKAKEVLRFLNITRPTLSKYIKEGKLIAFKNTNGQYTYDDKSVFGLLNKGSARKHVVYARVSTTSQKKDLENQIETISQFMCKNGITVDYIYKDVKSGMDLDRIMFSQMLDDVISYKIDTIYITYKDRLTRISYDMITKLLSTFGTKVIVISSVECTKTNEQEFMEEVATLIHSFSMKMYSKRRKEKLELVAKDLKLEHAAIVK